MWRLKMGLPSESPNVVFLMVRLNKFQTGKSSLCLNFVDKLCYVDFMIRFSHILCMILMTSFAVSTQAQDTSKPEKKAEPGKAKKVDPKESDKAVEDTIDLDAFFKKGEENADTASCSKPAKPANPIA